MNYGIFDFLTVIGALGLFLFGMKQMSEALQKVAGQKMRNILAKMTSNRFKGILTGFLVTSGIQSSSATTVMMVSFVNAGLLSLIGAIGVIMGANIGTTVTGWIVALFGFKIKMNVLALPLIAVFLPLFFSKRSKRRSWAEFIFGFAILFIGLQFLKESMPDVKENPGILNFLAGYTDMGYGSYLLFLLIGTILTIIIQSSSATMALTLVMCNEGWISYDLAASMILGENIGTTITANLAAIIANTAAKRAARAHFIFNVIGVIWVMMIFPMFLRFIEWIVILAEGVSPYDDPSVTPTALSAFHTIFNIANTLVLVGFARGIEKIVVKMVPERTDEEGFRLKHIGTGLLMTSELSIVQAKEEIVIYADRAIKAFGLVREMFNAMNEKKVEELFTKVRKYEDIIDRMEVEIAKYLTKVSEGELSSSGSKKISGMLKLISDIESIADSCYNLAITIDRKKQRKIWFDQEFRNNINKMFGLAQEALNIMRQNLDEEYESIDISKANDAEKAINMFRDKLRLEHAENIRNDKYNYETGIYYSDLFAESEKLGDYVINVSEAVTECVGQNGE
ncbi:MAG: Na/Pi cotransporter family protein [Bacteroidetes bacterium]|nr:Na/Pi cotransporter family protein [Bacteroidota bacterium]